MNNMLAMRKAFTALASNTEGQGSLQDTQTSSMSSVAHLLMGNGSFDNQESVSSTYMKGTPGNGSSSPSSPQLHLQVFNSLDQASNVNAQHFKEEIGDNRLEPDTKEGSLTSGRDHQDMLSSGNTLPDKLLPREKKKLKPTSSCYYYQQNNVAPVATFLPQKEEIPPDKMSLNLETQTRPGFVTDDSTKSVKNYNIGHSKRKNTETMHSPQIDCLSGGASEFSNLNFPKLEPNMGIDSPISTRSIELVKTKSNRDKNEKKTWGNGDNDKMTGKQLEEKQRAEIYRNDGQRRYVNSPKQHYAKKRHPNGGGNNGNNGASKQGASSGAGSLYQSTGLNDDNFPRIDEMPETKVKVKRSEHFDRQDKLPLGLHQPTENRRRRGGDRKTKK